MIDFHKNSHAIKYIQHDENNFLFISLASAIYYSTEHFAEKAIDSPIESSLKSESLGYLDSIKFANKIMTDRVREKGDQHLRNNMVK